MTLPPARRRAPEAPSPPAGAHLPALDGVRGVAILLVLLLHFTVYGGPPPSALPDRIFHELAAAGWVGVDLFFVLSGFLITGILYDAKGSRRYFRNFYARRVLRIFPLYYGSLLIFLVLLPALFPEHAGLQSLRRDGPWYWAYLSNVLVAREGWPEFGALGHFWSLAVEEQFYLLWPVVVLLCSRRTLMVLCLTLVAASFALRVGLGLAGRETAAFVLTPARIDALAAGGLLALAARGPHGLRPLSRWARPAAAASAVALASLFVWRRGLPAEDFVVSTVGYTLLACLFAALVLLALTSPPQAALGRLFASSGLVFFGRYSYGLYVFHHPLLFLKPQALSYGALPTVLGSRLPGLLLFLLAATAVSAAAAFLSWHLYEKQFLKLKERFPYERRRAAPAAIDVEQVPAP
ncbi:MAG TPA: acyltransferase [Thermoanaerobaculia bacterium]|nr:acyltransferase [Thermoanaerobaculia bacterium]